MQLIGHVPDYVRFMQWVNPTGDTLNVWWQGDGVAAPLLVETVAANSSGPLHCCPGPDLLVGCTTNNLGPTPQQVWLLLS